MSLHIRQNDQQTDLQKRIAAELQDKAKKRPINPEVDRPDGVEDSRYIESTKKTTSLAWAWALIGIASVLVLLWLTIVSVQA